MCQLLGMSCKEPANINFSFEGFRARGGLTDEHKDGWGIAFYRNNSFDVFLDHEPAANSVLADEIHSAGIKSKTIIAHIRKATVGEVKLTNCHPFQRELWGKTWLFCHNGDLKNFAPELTGTFQAQGDTDSELAFCLLLQRLEQEFGTHEPNSAELFHALDVFVREIESFGIFNIIFSNGDLLYTYCSTSLAYVERQFPFTTVTLVDKDVSLDLSKHNTQHDKMIVVATKPLTTNESWKVYQHGESRMFKEGDVLHMRLLG
jgi:predicted glutamine amidotransferase